MKLESRPALDLRTGVPMGGWTFRKVSRLVGLPYSSGCPALDPVKYEQPLKPHRQVSHAEVWIRSILAKVSIWSERKVHVSLIQKNAIKSYDFFYQVPKITIVCVYVSLKCKFSWVNRGGLVYICPGSRYVSIIEGVRCKTPN